MEAINKKVSDTIAAIKAEIQKDKPGDKDAEPQTSQSQEKEKDQQQATPQGKAQPGNKFFRSNRVTDAELKKRDYVAKELQATASAATGRVTRSSAAKLEPGDEAGNADDDAANFMAGVGVVTTPGKLFFTAFTATLKFASDF